MRLTKEVAGVPIFICETPAETNQHTWHWQLCKEISLFLPSLFPETLLRGIWYEDLDLVAQMGTDESYDTIGSMTYVVPHRNYLSVSYPLSRAATGLLVYKASCLTECYGDAENMNRDFNRYRFLVDPKEALLSIINVKDVNRISRTLKGFI